MIKNILNKIFKFFPIWAIVVAGFYYFNDKAYRIPFNSHSTIPGVIYNFVFIVTSFVLVIGLILMLIDY